MAEKTGIEWCDHTFNIAWGCVKVSPGCKNCYADRDATRYGFSVFGPPATTERRTFGPKHWQEPLAWNAAAEAEGVRKRVFCSSMCDVFEDHPTIDAEREKLWPLIRATPWLDWQLLTKRPERIAANLPADWGTGYPNVWLGTSVESQPYAWRAYELCKVPAAYHFISAEPLIAAVDLANIDLGDGSFFNAYDGFLWADSVQGGDMTPGDIDWVIAGGESEWNKNRRDMDIAWARSLRDQCLEYGAAFFLKQLGGTPHKKRGGDEAVIEGRRWVEMPA